MRHLPKIAKVLPVFIYNALARRYCRKITIFPQTYVAPDSNILVAVEDPGRDNFEEVIGQTNQKMITTANNAKGASML